MENSPAAQPTHHTDSSGPGKREMDILLVCNPKTNIKEEKRVRRVTDVRKVFQISSKRYWKKETLPLKSSKLKQKIKQ